MIGDDDDEIDEFNNDDTITANQTEQRNRLSFLHDSTIKLCPRNRFTVSTSAADEEDDAMINSMSVRSNSCDIGSLDKKAPLLNKTPKKVVRFADVLVCFINWKHSYLNNVHFPIREQIALKKLN